MITILTGTAEDPALAQAIADQLGLPLSDTLVTRFSDGEIRVQVQESVRGMDVFVVQPTCPPASENIMELLIILDALKRASARRITAVIPYYGYARQEKKIKPREPIAARLMADLITTAGANRIFLVDVHVQTIQGFFNLPGGSPAGRAAVGGIFPRPRLQRRQYGGGLPRCRRRGPRHLAGRPAGRRRWPSSPSAAPSRTSAK